MEATLIKKLDNGWPVYSLRRADGKMIATTRFPFDESALMIAKNAGIELQKLSHENCDEIFGVVNVEKLVEEEYFKFDQETRVVHRRQLQESLASMFNKATELNKDKVFTLEDLENFRKFQIQEQNFSKSCLNVWLQSLQQPTEIEVEIEMIPGMRVNGIQKPFPVKDSEGCLILKKASNEP